MEVSAELPYQTWVQEPSYAGPRASHFQMDDFIGPLTLISKDSCWRPWLGVKGRGLHSLPPGSKEIGKEGHPPPPGHCQALGWTESSSVALTQPPWTLPHLLPTHALICQGGVSVSDSLASAQEEPPGHQA